MSRLVVVFEEQIGMRLPHTLRRRGGVREEIPMGASPWDYALDHQAYENIRMITDKYRVDVLVVSFALHSARDLARWLQFYELPVACQVYSTAEQLCAYVQEHPDILAVLDSDPVRCAQFGHMGNPDSNELALRIQGGR